MGAPRASAALRAGDSPLADDCRAIPSDFFHHSRLPTPAIPAKAGIQRAADAIGTPARA